MSQMQANRGIIKELYADIENPEEKIIQLHLDTMIPFDDLVWIRESGEIEWDYIEHDDYAMLNYRLFDVSGAPDDDDYSGDRNDIRPLGGGEYEVDLYYYNGGTNMEELVEEYLEKEAAGVMPDISVFYTVKINKSYFLPNPTQQFNIQAPMFFQTEQQAVQHMKQFQAELSESNYKVVAFRES